MPKGSKLYFISDIHLGVPPFEQERERMFVAWLDSIKDDAAEVFLLGDIFDFWFTYKHVVPRGGVRVLGKLAELADSGITVHYATGNHDMWIFDYFSQELGLRTYTQPWEFTYDGRHFMVGHGDGLGKSDRKYNFLKLLFSSTICRRLFASLHPWIGMTVAHLWSGKSRSSHTEMDLTYFGHDKEDITKYCIKQLENKHYDYFVFGHRHLRLDIDLGGGARYINLGQWMTDKYYAVYHDGKMTIKDFSFSDDRQQIE